VPDVSAVIDMPDLAGLAAGAYAVVVLFVAVDAVFPIVPGETVVIAGGVLAVAGDLHLAALLSAAAVGAIAGDCAAYALGRRAGRAGLGRALRARRSRRAILWVASTLESRAAAVVLAARFVPGGRTSAALTAGFLRFPVGKYARWSALAGVMWSVYAAGLGYVGGRTFATRPWIALLAALAVAAAIGCVAFAMTPRARTSASWHNAGRVSSCEMDAPGGAAQNAYERAAPSPGERTPERCG
jgi:membrane-associated protein